MRGEKLELAKRRFVPDALLQTLTTVLVFGSLGFVAYGAVHGQSTVGDLVMYYLAFQRAQTYLRMLLDNLVFLYEDSLFLTICTRSSI